MSDVAALSRALRCSRHSCFRVGGRVSEQLGAKRPAIQELGRTEAMRPRRVPEFEYPGAELINIDSAGGGGLGDERFHGLHSSVCLVVVGTAEDVVNAPLSAEV